MKVLLVFPNSPIISEPCCDGFNPVNLMPYEIINTAGSLKQSFEVKLLDAKALGLSREAVQKETNSFKPEMIVVWSTSYSYLKDIPILEFAKAKGIATVLVLNPPILTTQVLERFLYIDAIALDDREFVLKKIASAIEKGKDFSNISGIAFREQGKAVEKKLTKPHDYSELPLPAFELAPMDSYVKRDALLISSRGCPFQCTFCFWGHSKWRSKKPEQTADEVELLVNKYGFKSIGFPDQNFTIDKNYVFGFCDEIEKRGLNFTWHCDSRVESAQPELLKRMKETGCDRIFYGIEHISDEILKNMHKSQDKEEVLRAVKLTQKIGIPVVTPFIIGLPGETKQTLKELKDFIVELKPWNYNVLFPIPYPGTELYDQTKKNGWLKVEDKPENYWMSPSYYEPLMVVPPLTKEDLLKARKWLQIFPRVTNPTIFLNTIRDGYARGGIGKVLQFASGAASFFSKKKLN
ncbi:MAG: hypothetical protein CL943_00660 [Candidatus Diapherotrites archaeon]|uniref:Radical SAM core domain-containing protein n=1 Tax=Candidatus Iainarchaeum sp. TaxID=3101447 RepID=A0A2D6M061_9ARCH|nr:hypothetical protein [Candidatus Diapherotrites archaeon]|tara:strand:- start:933 stop:2324 length:1392 start_codon:yes stop_codon:yes gene_type:complete